ncbi:MAG: hypothetical protein GY791_02975 [Alphaproteobacteria bacterium]|nr:hypothetical protein [Alphaproteobacteria bacterium]
MCRKWSAEPFMSVHCPGVATFAIDESLAWYKGPGWAERGLCEHCGSSLFWRLARDHRQCRSWLRTSSTTPKIPTTKISEKSIYARDTDSRERYSAEARTAFLACLIAIQGTRFFFKALHAARASGSEKPTSRARYIGRLRPLSRTIASSAFVAKLGILLVATSTASAALSRS